MSTVSPLTRGARSGTRTRTGATHRALNPARLPFRHSRIMGCEGVEPPPRPCKSRMLPLHQQPLVGHPGVEPGASCSRNKRRAPRLVPGRTGGTRSLAQRLMRAWSDPAVCAWVRELDSNQRAPGYEPGEVSRLLNPATTERSPGVEPGSQPSEGCILSCWTTSAKKFLATPTGLEPAPAGFVDQCPSKLDHGAVHSRQDLNLHHSA